MGKEEINTAITNWGLDCRFPPYRDCTDGNFECERGFNKGDRLRLDLNGMKYTVKVYISELRGNVWTTYFDISDDD